MSREEDGRVSIAGTLNAGTTNASMMILILPYFPSPEAIHAVYGSYIKRSAAMIEVENKGQIYIVSRPLGAAWLSLDSLILADVITEKRGDAAGLRKSKKSAIARRKPSLAIASARKLDFSRCLPHPDQMSR